MLERAKQVNCVIYFVHRNRAFLLSSSNARWSPRRNYFYEMRKKQTKKRIAFSCVRKRIRRWNIIAPSALGFERVCARVLGQRWWRRRRSRILFSKRKITSGIKWSRIGSRSATTDVHTHIMYIRIARTHRILLHMIFYSRNGNDVKNVWTKRDSHSEYKRKTPNELPTNTSSHSELRASLNSIHNRR